MKPPAGEWPVADLILPLPMTVAADIYWALGQIEKRGYAAFFKETDGLGRMWVRWPR